MSSPASHRPAGPPLILLVALAVGSILTLNVVLPSLGNLAAAFDLGFGTASLVISAYILTTAVLQLIVGPLSDIWGRRPMILGSLAVFVLASLGCALATDFVVFMAFRILQAAVITANVLSRAIIRDTSPPEEAAARLGTMGMAFALGPMLAPMIGGVLDSVLGWRANFWAFTLLGVVLLIWSARALPETAPLQGGGVLAQIRAYPSLLRDGTFWSYTFCMGLSVGVFFAFLTAAAALGTEVWGMSEAVLGLCLGAPPLGFLLGNFLTTRLSRRMPGARLILGGRLVTLLGMVGAATTWALGVAGPVAFFVWMPLVGVGNGLTFPSATVGAMAVPARLTGAAAGLSGAMVLGVAAATTATTGAVLGHPPSPGLALALLGGLALAALLAGLPAVRRDWDGIVRAS
ncbi:MFS transporter [Jannaschia seohaensis]|uniref:DHA1 family bicyclomycin/chloramphenicol resistance-like MFS transporter n=1 Tax=Jannaschia seohaensis TaxID=475081 RepID=A0A2Y9B403_9RHOB|nr:MFS transporter [Jannaschia seohaensis]PWJ12127.1 DHA1 family bicyclomycin/chloramphenicol resistance-like MFS transporter [Jannaschia seohaensis]SSA51230.1 MFS transporter, DHA1 family, bicyclomycin/chloramphenicol resistance protein [Jannaschia seohaensis]